MPDADSWEHLAKSFQDLDRDGVMSLHWFGNSDVGEYYFSFIWPASIDFYDQTIYGQSQRHLKEARFLAISTRAAKKLGSEQPRRFWLHALRKAFSPSAETTATIGGICLRAAELCYRIEAGYQVDQSLPKQKNREITDTEMTRSERISAFVNRCNDLGVAKIYKRHLWLCVGHKKPRQFEYWQAGSNRATATDNQNFGRLLTMTPEAFIDLLRQKKIIT